MKDQTCKCGHVTERHLHGFIARLLLRISARGRFSCSLCDCNEFRIRVARLQKSIPFTKYEALYADEWQCDHGIGHPYQDLPHHGGGVHGCDGCCTKSIPFHTTKESA